MKSMTLLGLDTESGGISVDCDLLQINLSVINDNFEIVDKLSLDVKPDPYNGRTSYQNIEAEALRVNKIDLAQHDLTAITYKESKPIIYNWLQNAYSQYGSLTPFGQNVQRDINIITRYTISTDSWFNFCDRRVIDTISLGKFAQMLGIIPMSQSLSLSKVTKYLGIEVDESLLHTAEYDVALGAKYIQCLYEKLSR